MPCCAIHLLQKQVEQAAAERPAQGADAGSLYQQLADELEAEHEKVSVLEVRSKVLPPSSMQFFNAAAVVGPGPAACTRTSTC